VLDAIAQQMPADGILYLGGAETVLGITTNVHMQPGIKELESKINSWAESNENVAGCVGILAFGSLIDDPGPEIEAALIDRKLNVRTPFNIEFARASIKRGGTSQFSKSALRCLDKFYSSTFLKKKQRIVTGDGK
jgi:hypothetical protein